MTLPTENDLAGRARATQNARAALREAVWIGATKGEKKLVLLRLCEDADITGVVKVKPSRLAGDIGQATGIVRQILKNLVNRGDLAFLCQHSEIRTYRLSPRR